MLCRIGCAAAASGVEYFWQMADSHRGTTCQGWQLAALFLTVAVLLFALAEVLMHVHTVADQHDSHVLRYDSPTTLTQHVAPAVAWPILVVAAPPNLVGDVHIAEVRCWFDTRTTPSPQRAPPKTHTA